MNTTTTTPPPTTATPAEVAGALYRAFGAHDLDGVASLVAEDAVLHVPGTHPLAGDHVGRDGVLAFLVGIATRADRTEHLEVLDLLGGTEHAAVYCHVTGTRDGRVDLDNTSVHVLRVESGLVTEVWFHNWDQVAVDGFWS